MFNENSFSNGLKPTLNSVKNLDPPSFEDIFINVQNTHAPTKTKILRANNDEVKTSLLGKQ